MRQVPTEVVQTNSNYTYFINRRKIISHILQLVGTFLNEAFDNGIIFKITIAICNHPTPLAKSLNLAWRRPFDRWWLMARSLFVPEGDDVNGGLPSLTVMMVWSESIQRLCHQVLKFEFHLQTRLTYPSLTSDPFSPILPSRSSQLTRTSRCSRAWDIIRCATIRRLTSLAFVYEKNRLERMVYNAWVTRSTCNRYVHNRWNLTKMAKGQICLPNLPNWRKSCEQVDLKLPRNGWIITIWTVSFSSLRREISRIANATKSKKTKKDSSLREKKNWVLPLSERRRLLCMHQTRTLGAGVRTWLADMLRNHSLALDP